MAITTQLGQYQVSQYGRRGTTGQVSIKQGYATSAMYDKIDAKRNKGYSGISPQVKFDWPTAPTAMTVGLVHASDLAQRFDQAWTDRYRPLLTALAQPTSQHHLVVFTNNPEDFLVWPWLKALVDIVTQATHLIDPLGAIYAFVPSSAMSHLRSYFPGSALLRYQDVGPTLPTDDATTLEIFAGIWTPHATELDTSDASEALAAARLLVPAS
jgi:hypothetical protein